MTTGNKGIVSKFGLKHYPNGERVSPKLPKSYQLVNGEQNCHNCSLYKNDNCELWKAKVKDNYWCKSWKHGVKVGNNIYDRNLTKTTIMERLRKRIRPESFSKQRPTINVRNNTVINRISKGRGRLTQPYQKDRIFEKERQMERNIKSPKVRREAMKRLDTTIGSLKRSRKRKR